MIIRDVLLTFAGLAVIMDQVFAVPVPSTQVLLAGLAMSGIGASFHLGTIINGFVGHGSSPSHVPQHGSSHSSASPGSSDD